METTLKAQKNYEQTAKQNVKVITDTTDIWAKAEAARFGIIPMLLIFVGCLSGIAAAFGTNGNIIELAFIAFPTIISLALTLAVAPMRVIAFASIAAVVCDLLILII